MNRQTRSYLSLESEPDLGERQTNSDPKLPLLMVRTLGRGSTKDLMCPVTRYLEGRGGKSMSCECMGKKGSRREVKEGEREKRERERERERDGDKKQGKCCY